MVGLTAEQPRAHARLLELGVTVIVNTLVSGLKPGAAVLRCVFSGAEREIAAECFVPVTSRDGDDALYHALKGRGLASLSLIGDARAPGLIVHAVYAGHKLAREFGEDEVMVGGSGRSRSDFARTASSAKWPAVSSVSRQPRRR